MRCGTFWCSLRYPMNPTGGMHMCCYKIHQEQSFAWRCAIRCKGGASRLLTAVVALMISVSPVLCQAQPKPDVTGDYSARLGVIHLKLHLRHNPDGSFVGLLDSPDQG